MHYLKHLMLKDIMFHMVGTIEDLTSDQVTLVNGGDSVKFTGLTPNQSVVNVTAKR